MHAVVAEHAMEEVFGGERKTKEEEKRVFEQGGSSRLELQADKGGY